ncbi:putative damage-inducible protein DinB [Arcticibacter pallidicorallinus]|uniref:Putative damage-inducible protein DinB n=1 Tax=Arcticibacter pallidicorallinus TaxID=1259464 RepID=A0A2T0U4I2_9SPHI|nr:DinB family protein [Arcticibacter pallidicorallinus]PRY52800.1 putative damage-inducible protein DinB [Arcticibacter pallidicorallinus]
MNTTAQEITQETKQVISQDELLNHWQGHRNLTRRVIEAFPEKEFFEFSIGGMRTFAELTAELLAIGAPGIKGIVTQEVQPYQEDSTKATTKAEYLEKWDKATSVINDYWSQLRVEDFSKTFNLFGEYEFPVIQNILYFIDNEVHHRGQGYVYLRALGVEPPFFWER